MEEAGVEPAYTHAGIEFTMGSHHLPTTHILSKWKILVWKKSKKHHLANNTHALFAACNEGILLNYIGHFTE